MICRHWAYILTSVSSVYNRTNSPYASSSWECLAMVLVVENSTSPFINMPPHDTESVS